MTELQKWWDEQSANRPWKAVTTTAVRAISAQLAGHDFVGVVFQVGDGIPGHPRNLTGKRAWAFKTQAERDTFREWCPAGLYLQDQNPTQGENQDG